MNAKIRSAVASDASAIVALGREIDPHPLATEESFRCLGGVVREAVVKG